MDSRQIADYLFAVEAVGAVFFAVVWAAFTFGLRATSSNVVLHSEPVFRMVLSVFGGLLLLTVGVAVVLSFAVKKRGEEESPM